MVLLDMRRACSFADYIVICSGESDRQLDAICSEILDTLRKEAVIPYHSEGRSESGWMLLDYQSVIVHIFSREMRSFYDLENIYVKAPRLLRVQ